MKQPKVSIIIPIYNAEKYLYQCLNSIKNQSYKNIEVIMVNDGSTDTSSDICEKYLEDCRFKLINKKNGGVSSARNIGIEECSGEYILFVDSDDWCDINLLTETIEGNEIYDLICFSYFKAYKDKEIKEELRVEKDSDIKKEILFNKTIGGYLWNKVFKSKIIKEYHIKFNENISYCEDLLFIKKYIEYVKKVKYINKPLYYYRIRKSSISNNFYSIKNISILNACELLIDEYREDKIFVNDLMFSYILNYYKLRKFIPNNFNINLDILSKENELSNNKNIKEKIKFKFIKYFPKAFIKLKYFKDKKMNLYD